MHDRRMIWWLLGLLVFAGVVFVLHTTAMERYLYWYFWWYDVMMHFLGGALVGGIAAWGLLRLWPNITPRQLAILTVGSALAVGIGWEFFEYFSGIYVGEVDIVADTIQDLVMDALGGIAAWQILSRALRSPRPTTEEAVLNDMTQ